MAYTRLNWRKREGMIPDHHRREKIKKPRRGRSHPQGTAGSRNYSGRQRGGNDLAARVVVIPAQAGIQLIE